MFKVECPGCKAPYQVDERRIPPTGLKMRCPKCGTSFQVDPSADPQRTGPSAVLGAALGVGADSLPPPVFQQPRPANVKSTMLGVAPGSAPRAARPAAPVAPSLVTLPPNAVADFGDIDLPSPVAPPHADLPMPAAPRAAPPPRAGAPAPPPRPAPPAPPRRAAATPATLGADPDLPAAVARAKPAAPVASSEVAAAPSGLELDLPSVAGSTPKPAPERRAASFGEIELDLPSPSPPAPRTTAGSPTHSRPPRSVDLPSPVHADLPNVRSSSPSMDSFLPGVPRTSGRPPLEIDLPTIGGSGLPSISNAALPSLGGSGLPALGGAGLPIAPESLPRPRQPSGQHAGMAAAASAVGRESFGDVELPLIPSLGSAAPPAPRDALESDPFGEAVLAPPRAVLSSRPAASSAPAGGLPSLSEAPLSDAALVRKAGGGTAYGEVDLNMGGEGEAEVPLAAAPSRPPPRSEEDMEFGGVPQESVVAARAPSLRAARPVSLRAQEAATRARGKRSGVRLFAGAFVVLVGGASLALIPAVGPFGAYWIVDQVRAGEYEKVLSDAAARARRRFGKDTWAEARAALRDVEATRSAAKRVRGLRAYAALLGFTQELRFGPEPQVHARAKVLLDELEGEQELPYLQLARAAGAATEGQLARARQDVQSLLRQAPKDADALVLQGEVELLARDARAALSAWSALAKVEPSARAAFGLARARFSAGDTAGALAEAERALSLNPGHVGARILVARIDAQTRSREVRAVRALEGIAKQSGEASPHELVSVQTLLGDIHLSRSRISGAEAAYAEALKIDPKAARALIGLGEALYRAGRYSEAQARFEASAQADPDDLLAKVGVAKSKLALERLDDAHVSLKKLRDSHPTSLVVGYWYGKVLEALGHRDAAERVYRDGIGNTKADPLLVDTYVALAMLQNQQGRSEEARKTLSDARARLPTSAAIHRALGDVAISQGRYGDAQVELKQAIALDPEDLGARFRLGVALRRDGKFDTALAEFEEVTKVDRDFPGLALERGLLYEAAGRTEEALKAYEGALAKAPEDPDLMLRVGCGYAGAGRAKDAQALLRKVLSQRPTSAETNHCLGRALLAEGSRLADALRSLDRAVELDPHRAEYHLYVGWAANEAGNVPKAERALDEAIKLDQGLADAYWQRGVLRARQGAVRDAIFDLNRALALRPSRYEAHAALADAYYDLGKEDQALTEWRTAVEANPDNATWRFRYGKLLAANQRNEAARAELSVAIELASKATEPSRWLWEAHHLLARAMGARPEAAKHWEQFLRLGPLDSPYRAEAKAALEKLGRAWTGN